MHCLLPADSLPTSLCGLARHDLQNALFAAALAQGLGVAIEDIRTALASFRCDRETVPGRLNLFDGHPFTVIMDYGHNQGGYQVIGPLVTRSEEHTSELQSLMRKSTAVFRLRNKINCTRSTTTG